MSDRHFLLDELICPLVSFHRLKRVERKGKRLQSRFATPSQNRFRRLCAMSTGTTSAESYTTISTTPALTTSAQYMRA
jgi:hypothetical protein